ncbi:MAG: hypothetical protein WAW83_11195, partial [Trichococcus flocculiformis]
PSELPRNEADGVAIRLRIHLTLRAFRLYSRKKKKKASIRFFDRMLAFLMSIFLSFDRTGL